MNDEMEQKESEEKSDQPVQAEQPDKSGQGNKDDEIKDSIPQWVSELDSFPLREKDKDPKWAVRTVWIWIGFALACLAGILLLLVLGAVYD